MKPLLSLKLHGHIVMAVFLFCFSGRAYSQNSDVKVETKQIPAQKALVIKSTVPSGEISKAMGEMFGKLFGYLGAMNIQPSGPPFAVYYNFDPNGNTVFEAGVTIASDTKGNEEIAFKEFPAMKVVSSLHVGPYDKMGPLYDYLMKYMKDNGMQSSGTSWEIYLTDPAQETDTNKYQTLVYFPLK